MAQIPKFEPTSHSRCGRFEAHGQDPPAGRPILSHSSDVTHFLGIALLSRSLRKESPRIVAKVIWIGISLAIVQKHTEIFF